MNYMMKENSSYRNRFRQMPLCRGTHPGGGYVAWPKEETSDKNENKNDETLYRRRCIGRKGFVARPVKDAPGL